MPVALKALIETMNQEMLKDLLYGFSCETDTEIESFLHERAVLFEKLAKARTYLICDEEQLMVKDICHKDIIVYGYVSVAINVLTVMSEISNRTRKDIDGFSAKKHGRQLDSFPCYLIGQLSRNSNVSKDTLSGNQLIRIACEVIEDAFSSVGGRHILVECKEDDKLIEFYEKNQFSRFATVTSGNKTIIQLIRKTH